MPPKAFMAIIWRSNLLANWANTHMVKEINFDTKTVRPKLIKGVGFRYGST